MKSQVPEGKGSEMGRVWSPLELAEVKTPRRIGSIWRAKGATSRRRITFDDRASYSHLMSRTANGEFLFGATEDFKTSLACFCSRSLRRRRGWYSG
jgi:hypothetical protein